MNFIILLKKYLKKIAYWILPGGFYKIIIMLMEKREKEIYSISKTIIENNIAYRNTYNGKRCFILCNGPSVAQQDIRGLQNEIVFSVSNGYLHSDYKLIKPKYHCVPQLTYTEKFTKELAVEWFKEMDENIMDAELFLSHHEYEFVKNNNLFHMRNVNYLLMNKQFTDQKSIINIDDNIPVVQSVPIMCLFVSMYMGFKEIYLIGTDHDSFIKREYKYFYEKSIFDNKGYNVDKDGQIECLYTELSGYSELWRQYLIIKSIAENNNIEIFNATLGGALDVFKRVNLQSVINNN